MAKHAQSTWVRRILIGITCLALVGCSLQILPAGEQPSATESAFPHRVQDSEMVNVTISTTLSSAYSPESKLAIDVLDEVSGLNHNVQRFPMQTSENGTFQATLQLPLGAVIHYRYVSTAPLEIVEYTPNGEPVVYRSLLVTRNAQIKDSISAWPEKPYIAGVGKLNGIVTDSATDQPLADVLITVAGLQSFTDMTGRYYFENLPVGVHNLVAHTLDGSYLTFQQQANVVEGLATPAVIKLQAAPEVQGTFTVSLPNDAIGAPIRVAGNIYQLGNTFTDKQTGLSSNASRMPMMTPLGDGRYSLKVTLYAGTDLRYKYTLGDGFTNAERTMTGELLTRGFIVPDKDFEVEDEVASWRIANAEPATIMVSVPGNTPPEDSVSIQFQNGVWNQPIPMWPLGSNRWMYLLYTQASEEANPILYRFCRNDQCDLSFDPASNANPYPVDFKNPSANSKEVTAWQYWSPPEAPAEVEVIEETRNQGQLSGVEFISDYHPSQFNRYSDVFTELKKMGINWLIFTPSWNVSMANGLPYLDSDPDDTMLIRELKELVSLGQQLGFKIALYPQLNFPQEAAVWWETSQRDALWWQQWYIEYERFLLNYLLFSSTYKVDQFIIGGKDLSASLPGGLMTVGENYGTPKNVEEIWTELLSKMSRYFSGETLWAVPLTASAITDYSFFDEIDGFYFEAASNGMEAYLSQDSLSTYLDGVVSAFLSPYAKPAYFGLSCPSFTTNMELPADFDYELNPYHSGFGPANVDLFSQQYFYDIYESVLASLDWVKGVSSRGFFPVMKMTDFSTSVYGKPAMDVIWYYNAITN